MNIKKNDSVMMRVGKYRGKSGKVQTVLPKEGRLIVEGMNVVKKHVRARRKGEKGEVVEVARPVKASSVMLVCPSCKKPTRVGHRSEKDKKYRYCKKCNVTL